VLQIFSRTASVFRATLKLWSHVRHDYNTRRLQGGYDFATSSPQHATTLCKESTKLKCQFFCPRLLVASYRSRIVVVTTA